MKCLSCAHLAKHWELQPGFHSQGLLGWHLVASCFSKREKGVWLRVTVTDPPSGAASRAEGVENTSHGYGLFTAYGESHLPSVAPQLGFVQQQRSSSVLTVLSNCYFSPLSALQKQNAAGENVFLFPTYN